MDFASRFRAAFEKEMEGIPSTRSLGDLPPELHCPLCKEVIKDAVLTSKCCFTSFCDKCKVSIFCTMVLSGSFYFDDWEFQAILYYDSRL